MSRNRDRNQDRANTRDAILGKPLLSGNKNWLGHAGGAGRFDCLLVEGATRHELTQCRGAVNEHLSHLVSEHGLLVVERNGKLMFDRRDLGVGQDHATPSAASLPLRAIQIEPAGSVSAKSIRELPASVSLLSQDRVAAQSRLASIVKSLAIEKRPHLDELQANYRDLQRPDFLWHYLLQSFATMGRAAGWHGLIGNHANYRRVIYDELGKLTTQDRAEQVTTTCRQAKIRMPDRKAQFILGCCDRVTGLGGQEAAKAELLSQPGRDAKIQFLKTFPGIGDKYARNIMMDVYHEDFRDSIAVDVRIKGISTALGQVFSSYAEHEVFYLTIAAQSGVNGWELDRLLFGFRDEVLVRLNRRPTNPGG